MLVTTTPCPKIPPKAPTAIHLGDHHELIHNERTTWLTNQPSANQQGKPPHPKRKPILGDHHEGGSQIPHLREPITLKQQSMAHPKEESTG
ncbi:hypothetical protein Nepgr_030103 [Nepenthes gracilis]|uniref:Uncharacterized protein n=1 Tax=Nepenthes gracilis TaxID=150966 RepID=A0AAD3Y5I1_NEPGR|nr:hypothetical protein Nepgr_030103 [Nepenthes gracilis]